MARRRNNPFTSKHYVQWQTTDRAEFRGWLIEAVKLYDGTWQALGVGPEGAKEWADAVQEAKDAGQATRDIVLADFAGDAWVTARAPDRMDAVSLAAADIDFAFWMEANALSDEEADDILAVFLTAVETAHASFKSLGGYDSGRASEKAVRSLTAREAELAYKMMRPSQYAFQKRDRRTGDEVGLWEFFASIPLKTRMKWITRGIDTARHQRNAPIALSADQHAAVDKAMVKDRDDLIRSFDDDNRTDNPGPARPPPKTRRPPARQAKKRRKGKALSAAGIISRYVRG